MSHRHLSHLGAADISPALSDLVKSLLRSARHSTILSSYVYLYTYGSSHVYGQLGSPFICVGSAIRIKNRDGQYTSLPRLCCAILLPREAKKLAFYFHMLQWYNSKFSDWKHPSFASFLLYQTTLSWLINQPLQRYFEDLITFPCP